MKNLHRHLFVTALLFLLVVVLYHNFAICRGGITILVPLSYFIVVMFRKNLKDFKNVLKLNDND